LLVPCIPYGVLLLGSVEMVCHEYFQYLNFIGSFFCQVIHKVISDARLMET